MGEKMQRYKKPGQNLDQFFLIDQAVVCDLVKNALIGKNDIVLEIGAGSGIITKELSKKSKKIVAVEIDKRFSPDLKNLSSNVQVVFGNALKIISKVKFDVLVGNLPSSLVEPLMNKLTKVRFRRASLLVPLKFVSKLRKDKRYLIYFDIDLLEKIKPSSFFPSPKTNWAMLRLTKKTDPLKTQELDRYIEQYLFEHPKAKTINAKREALIRFYKVGGINLTKNQARKILLLTQNPPLP